MKDKILVIELDTLRNKITGASLKVWDTIYWKEVLRIQPLLRGMNYNIFLKE